ncbi:MAG: ABC transporter permease [Cytophagales bacterium]|nr:ABC transporter permease [Cytophagales bacterium]
MHGSVFKMVIRHFARYQVYSFLNLTGLVVGITTSMLVLIWVVDELQFDRYHPANEKVFMVLRDVTLHDGQQFIGKTTPGPLADYIRASIPEVELVCQTGFRERLTVSTKDINLYADVDFVEPEFFSLVNFPIVHGHPKNPMPNNQSVVLSEKMAAQLFGTKSEALGKEIIIFGSYHFTVSAVYHDPGNSSLSQDIFLPFYYHRLREGSTWDDSNEYILVKLFDKQSHTEVAQQLTTKLHEVWQSKGTIVFLFPLTDFHLYWNAVVNQHGSEINYVVGFAAIGLFILLMACVNFINLTTARAAIRAREIGVRKIAGASRANLIGQFLTESFLNTFIATGCALVLVYLCMPLFNSVSGKELMFSSLPVSVWVGLFVMALITGLLAGGYPAFLLSALKPATVLKGNLFAGLTGAGLRKGLIVFQFGLSVILVFSAIIVHQQIRFLQNKSLGFDKENVLYIEPGQMALPYPVFKTELLRSPHVTSVTQAAASPMEINGVGDISWKLNGARQTMNINNNPVDYDYFATLGIKIVQGRDFSPLHASDSNAIIITESAAALMGFDNPIGQMVYYNFDYPSEIIGVVNDFHNADIHQAGAPVAFYLTQNDYNLGRWKRIFIRYKPGAQKEIATRVENLVKKLSGQSTEIRFEDADFDHQFRADERVGILVFVFTCIAVLIACLGLFGLTLFNTQRRTKEIGVRKVLGASVPDVVLLLCSEFFKLIVVALVLALPISYYLMDSFLNAYLFRITISLLPFAVTVVILLFLAAATVSIQSVQAAQRNPADALKTD